MTVSPETHPLREHWKRHVRPEHYEWTIDLLGSLYYHSEHRLYHVSTHIEACLGHLDKLAAEQPEGKIDKELASLALIFHDAVYVPGQPDNEALSAALLEGVCLTLKKPALSAQVTPLILATGHKAEEGAFGDTTLAAVVDIDLSILGVEPAKYARYVGEVRLEFGHVSDEAWRVGRSIFLTKMLARKRIYTLAVMRAEFEAVARVNMTAELGRLK